VKEEPMRRSKRVALYVRVSTDGQTMDNRRLELEDIAARSGWEVVAIHADRGISGAKAREERPGFDALWKAVVRREIDMVATWSVELSETPPFSGVMPGKVIR
jgi:DNA invertase Pin-like site-specific DNA recombinase